MRQDGNSRAIKGLLELLDLGREARAAAVDLAPTCAAAAAGCEPLGEPPLERLRRQAEGIVLQRDRSPSTHASATARPGCADRPSANYSKSSDAVVCLLGIVAGERSTGVAVGSFVYRGNESWP
jgi:hypothetical protein